ncbi:MAG TPA: hypothetical protein VMP00_15495, partial [Burkholderiales bacterium]|nr:hypothetical protein [Burkholderiales bacterium]
MAVHSAVAPDDCAPDSRTMESTPAEQPAAGTMSGFRLLPWLAVALATPLLVACGSGTNEPWTPLSVRGVFTNLPLFNRPVAMLQAPGDGARWFVVQQAGVVRVFDNDPAVSATAVFVDLQAG